MVQELSERAARVHAQLVDPGTDNMLKITSDGRKLGLDQRIINPDLPDDPNSKGQSLRGQHPPHLAGRTGGQADPARVLRFVHPENRRDRSEGGKDGGRESGQPGASQRWKLSLGKMQPKNRRSRFTTTSGKSSLPERIPREQIAFIHEANTETRKKELFAKVRSGQVRVLMGSTFKNGPRV